MTDDKLSKVRAEIKRLKEIAEYNLSHSKMDRSAWMQQAAVCTKLLSFIDSMQEEPTSVWHDASEKPKEGSWICVSFASRDLSTFLYEDGKIHNNYVDIEMISCKWAYPEDLLKL